MAQDYATKRASQRPNKGRTSASRASNGTRAGSTRKAPAKRSSAANKRGAQKTRRPANKSQPKSAAKHRKRASPSQTSVELTPRRATGLWIVTLFSTMGLLIFLAYLAMQMPTGNAPVLSQPTASGAATIPTEPATTAQTPQNQGDSQRPKPKEFWTMLEEMSVDVPETTEAARQAQPLQDYYLQVGSFRSLNDADGLRAQLILKGFNVVVESRSNDKGTWHRVVTGPFKGRSKLANARSTLANQGLQTLTLKRPASETKKAG